MSAVRRFRPLKQRGALTWLAIAAAIALSVFYVEGSVQYISTPIAYRANGIDPYGRTNIEILSLIYSKGTSIALAKIVVTLLAVAGIAAALFGALIMWRTPDNPAARQIAGILMVYALLGAVMYFIGTLPEYKGLQYQAKTFILLLSAALIAYLALAIARFLVIFPRVVDMASVHHAYLNRPLFMRWTGTAPVEKSVILRKWHQHLVSGMALWLSPIFALIIVAGEIFPVLNDAALGGVFVVCIFVLMGFYLFFGMPYAFASITHISRFGTDDERRRIAWLKAVIFGIALVLLLFPCFGVANKMMGGVLMTPGMPITLFFILLALLLPPLVIVAIAFAVLKGGALDPRLAFTRVTLWSILSLILTTAFVVIERYAAVLLVQWFELPPDTGAIAAGAVIAGTFVPIRNLTRTQVNRLAERWIPLAVIAEGQRVTKLVAIADLSGYTALSAADEPAALLQSAALRRQGEKIARTHGGALVKSMGDAVMLTFADAPSGLRAIMELHAVFPGIIDSLGLTALRLHSALHVGEVVETHDADIFGQTVNVTARLVDAAAAGEIVVSQQVWNDAREQVELIDIGLRKFKNVPEPVHCYRVAGAPVQVCKVA